jgi:hypothetical protein
MFLRTNIFPARRQAASTKSGRVFKVFLLLVLVLAFNGCLIYETVEYRVRLDSNGKSGTILIRYNNIQSSSDDGKKQNEDFQELLDKWKGDKYLLERMNDGVYIKERDLKLSNRVLVWREVGIFSDVRKMNDGISYDDTTRISLAKDESVLATNGVVLLSKDSTVVVWPPHTRDFQIKIKNQDFKPTSHFADKFRQLIKKKKR